MQTETVFQEIVDGQKDMLYRICCAYTRNPDERKDLYQEVLVHIWKGLGSFRNEAGLKTWLYRITVNTCLTWIRGEQRRRKRFLQPTLNIEDRPAEEDNAADAESDLERLYECISRLRPVDRMLVSLHLEENDIRQIAEVMGISEGNVRIKLHRVKAELKELWREAGYEP